jgi:hypothetical protein
MEAAAAPFPWRVDEQEQEEEVGARLDNHFLR